MSLGKKHFLPAPRAGERALVEWSNKGEFWRGRGMGWMVGRLILGRLAHSTVLLVFSQGRQLHREIRPGEELSASRPTQGQPEGRKPREFGCV